jgi:polar amino acid transport system permease protein
MSDVDYIWSVLPFILEGLLLTVQVTLVSFAIALVIGLPVALARVSRNRALRSLAATYVMAIRNTPLLAQLFIYFFVLAAHGVLLSPLIAGVLALSTQFSAYIAEAYRGGYQSVPTGQWEAASAVGLGGWNSLIWVTGPQAIRPTIPVLANILIQMLKDSSVLSAITLTEVFGATKELASQSFRYTALYLTLGILYLAVSYPSGRVTAGLERRLGKIQ